MQQFLYQMFLIQYPTIMRSVPAGLTFVIRDCTVSNSVRYVALAARRAEAFRSAPVRPIGTSIG